METKTTRQDMERIHALLGNLSVSPGKLPLSFTYGGTIHKGLPEGGQSESRFLDANLVETTLTARLDSNVRIIAQIETYRDFPAVEWTVWFENDGTKTSALLEDLNAIDLFFSGPSPRLISNSGDFRDIKGYTDTTTVLDQGAVFEQSPEGGRPCDSAFPYQRLLFDDHGFSIAIGWPGQWHCRWEGLGDGARFTAGQETVHTVIKPGERFRTPRMCIVAFEGALERGINVWRRWYNAHVLPRSNGKPFPNLVQTGDNGNGEEWTDATEEQQLDAIKRQTESGVGAQLWWIDAGWYSCTISPNGNKSWPHTGTWEPDSKRFPHGLRPIGEACKAAGMEFVLWFEPERVRPGTWLSDNHPEWLLRRHEGTTDQNVFLGSLLLDLTQPDCLKWLCEHTTALIQDSGVTVYRQDFNFPPLPYWRENESESRQGMIENKYVQGYLAYWDYLLLHNPGLMIDSCSSGGRRNDLETMRRAVPFHQTDYGYGIHPVKQKFGQLLYSWIPYYRGFCHSWDDEKGEYTNVYYNPPPHPPCEEYDLFCSFAPMMRIYPIGAIHDRPEAVRLQKEMVALYKRVCHHFTHDDFYALTPHHCSRERWTAWQFDSPEAGNGILQFFRNNNAPEETLTVTLRGLSPDARYLLENGRTGEKREMTGTAAMTEGFTEKLEKRHASLWIYKRIG